MPQRPSIDGTTAAQPRVSASQIRWQAARRLGLTRTDAFLVASAARAVCSMSYFTNALAASFSFSPSILTPKGRVARRNLARTRNAAPDDPFRTAQAPSFVDARPFFTFGRLRRMKRVEYSDGISGSTSPSCQGTNVTPRRIFVGARKEREGTAAILGRNRRSMSPTNACPPCSGDPHAG